MDRLLWWFRVIFSNWSDLVSFWKSPTELQRWRSTKEAVPSSSSIGVVHWFVNFRATKEAKKTKINRDWHRSRMWWQILMEMEICNRTVICNVWCLSVGCYNEEGQKLCGSSREKKKKMGDLERQREEEEKRRMEKTREKKKKWWTSKKRELIKGKFNGCPKGIGLGNNEMIDVWQLGRQEIRRLECLGCKNRRIY